MSMNGGTITRRQWAGLFLGFLGLVLVVSRKLGQGGEVSVLTMGLALMALLSITVGTLYQKRFVAPCDVRSANAIQLAAALLVTLRTLADQFPGDPEAMVALNQFKATAARDAKRPLSYATVRALQIRVRAPGSGSVSIDLPRAAAPEPAVAQAPARRPGGGAKENFDLSTFYAIDGALADSDNNLIPDRVDVLLSAEGDGSEGIIRVVRMPTLSMAAVKRS